MNDPHDVDERGARAADLPPSPVPQPELGSFRDRNGSVYYHGGRVFRALSARAFANWQCLQAAPFYERHRSAGRIVETWPTEAAAESWAGVIEHARIPFVSYPYEWPFGMLKDAALLHLDLMRDALAADMILKDASPYNVQWRGAQPVFIDIPSFEPLRRGEPWVGYRQFCELFLYPLMLGAYKGMDFRPWLRGRIDGIPAEEMRRLISARDMLRRGVFLHVVMHSALQRRYSSSGRDARGTLVRAGFDKALILRNVEKLAALVSGFALPAARTEWADYDRNHSYDAAEFARKADFVRAAAATRRWRLAWDLGCNTGTFARIAAEHAGTVVAMDGDPMAIERLYQDEKAAGGRTILPLVANLADASPNQGWLGAERKGLAERGRPDLTLCLALVHHIVIGANIPLAGFIRWLAGLGTSVVIEWVGRGDEMVQTLLASREDQYADYHAENFRELLAAYFDVRSDAPLKGGKRHIYFAEALPS